MSTIAGVSRAAVLVELSVSVYSGRKKDRQTQDEVTVAKGAQSKQAASVYKSLFADCAELDAITKYQARVRAEHYKMTLPWSDSGLRLLPTAKLFDYQQMIADSRREFDALVQQFVARYDTLVAAAAFQLGALFDRSEYPDGADICKKFRMETSMYPVPTSGDFRLDIESSVQQGIVDKYEAQMQSVLEESMRDAWGRLHGVLSAMSDRLTVDVQEDGTEKKRVFRDTVVANALEVCDVLKYLNITGDLNLDAARLRLEQALVGVSAEDLRKSDGTRATTKATVDSILSDFDWSLDLE